MNIVIASKNPVKVSAVKAAFISYFPKIHLVFQTVTVPSGVSHQPMDEEETLTGAVNRATGAKKQIPDADFWVGIEGGVHAVNREMMTFAWVVIIGKEKTGKGRTASFFLPDKIVRLIRSGKELGEADDVVFGKTNSKQEMGAIGLLTDNRITRKTLYEPAIIIALVPFIKKELFF